MLSPSRQLQAQCPGFLQWQYIEGGTPLFLLAALMSIGTPMEIFAGGATAGAQGARPHTAGADARAGRGAGTQWMGGLAGGVGSIGGHEQMV